MTQNSHEKTSEHKRERRPRKDGYEERRERRYKYSYFSEVSDDLREEEELNFNHD